MLSVDTSDYGDVREREAIRNAGAVHYILLKKPVSLCDNAPVIKCFADECRIMINPDHFVQKYPSIEDNSTVHLITVEKG